MKRIALFTALLGIFAASFLRADQEPQVSDDQRATIASSLKWQTGEITLKDGIAKLKLSPDFRYLNHEDTEKVLHELWHNPPDPGTLGMIFPANLGPLDKEGWGVVLGYEEEGYVKDDDAEKINYTDLLKKMQQQVHEENDERMKEGYASLELAGWATPPHYDKAAHKLYWAKRLAVGTEGRESLNYDVRVLGRRGVLVLSGVADMAQFAEVDNNMGQVMAMVDFQPGNLYSDFDPQVDKVAKYGIATLIAGGVIGAAAKFGLLKFMLPILLVLKKAGIVIVVALVAGFKKLMGLFKNKSEARPFNPPSSSTSTGAPLPELRPPPAPGDIPPLRGPGEKRV